MKLFDHLTVRKQMTMFVLNSGNWKYLTVCKQIINSK